MHSTLKLLTTSILLATLTACSGDFVSDDVGISNTGSNSNAAGSGGSGGGTPTETFSISGSLSGLAAGRSVTLKNGSDEITLDSSYNGQSFTFAGEVPDQTQYDISVSAQPTGQTCVVENGSGTIDGMIINNITVECVDGSYTKIGSSGIPLANQTLAYSAAGSEAASDKWDCVQDSASNLMWEVKTTDGGLRDSNWTYTWYDSNPATNGGDWGIGDTGVGTTTGFENYGGTYVYDGSDNCSDSNRCDTEKFVADVNNNGGICGHTDWRLPTKDELAGLLTCEYPNCTGTGPYIDQSYFPNTVNLRYWSSSANANYNSLAWYVSFDSGGVNGNGKNGNGHVRLVRGGEPLSIAIAGSGTVSDDPTNYLAGCSDDCTQYYTVGDTVTLTATADSGQQFTGWTGDCDSISGNDCTITITTGQSVAASFTEPNPNTTGYTKMYSSGGYLADTATDWDCVMDNDSSLMWEVKTTDSGLRHKHWSYMNNTTINTPTNWDPIIDGGYDSGICQASSSYTDGITCDTEGYIDGVNSAQLCGHGDWRLPTQDELAGLLTCSDFPNCGTGPHIEQSYFPNTQVISYWSSSGYGVSSNYAWKVDFSDGHLNLISEKHGSGRVRLVRDTQ